jgi:hypothetical protein
LTIVIHNKANSGGNNSKESTNVREHIVNFSEFPFNLQFNVRFPKIKFAIRFFGCWHIIPRLFFCPVDDKSSLYLFINPGKKTLISFHFILPQIEIGRCSHCWRKHYVVFVFEKHWNRLLLIWIYESVWVVKVEIKWSICHDPCIDFCLCTAICPSYTFFECIFVINELFACIFSRKIDCSVSRNT